MFHQHCVCVYSLHTSSLGNYRDQDGEEDVVGDTASRQRAIDLAPVRRPLKSRRTFEGGLEQRRPSFEQGGAARRPLERRGGGGGGRGAPDLIFGDGGGGS
jgi:hypothetical protein